MSDPQTPDFRSKPAPKTNFLFWIGLIVAVALGAWGEIDRVLARNDLGKETSRDAVPTVVIVKPARTELGEDLVLQRLVQAVEPADREA